MPSYQLTVVVDDAAQEITEVVRGADHSSPPHVSSSTVLGLIALSFYHCDLMLDGEGNRLAKRNKALIYANYEITGKLRRGEKI